MDKHGIYRIIPYRRKIGMNKMYKTPIKLISITDKAGREYNYTKTTNSTDGTLTWKIGDENIQVKGVNDYIIKYHVENAISEHSSDFDELYWNLNGNFWKMEIDNYSAKIIFPSDFIKDQIELNIDSGIYGSQGNDFAQISWDNSQTISVKATRKLREGEGITLSLLHPKNYFSLYNMRWYIRYQWMLLIIIPVFFFFLAYSLWKKYGKDPKISPVITPEFEIPENLAPIEMGMIYSDGILHNRYLSAAIINLAVKGVITIELKKEGTILKTKEYLFHKTGKNEENLPLSEKLLIDKLFGGKQMVSTFDLKEKFYKKITEINILVKNNLAKRGWIIDSSRWWQYGFIVFIIIIIIISILSWLYSTYLGISLMISAIIFATFTPLMNKRSEKGTKYFKRIQGLKLYMTKAEKYRQQFNEKENIFEKFLPYAIMFGITSIWAKKMEILYSKEYLRNYHPVWFYGFGNSNFNFDSFSSDINSLSSTIGETLSSSPSSSGAGGGGFSGGGGGGGGGGGW